MTRNDIITALTTATNRSEIVAALKAADAYSGKLESGVYISRANKADLTAHARTVGAALVAADKADAKKANKGKLSAARSAARTPRTNTEKKIAQLIINATPDADGVVIADADAFVMAGLGSCWVRTSNKRWTDPTSMQARCAARMAMTAHSTRGTVVFTPVTEEAINQAS